MRLLSPESFKATPLQRTERKAYRDSSNLLHRVTSPNHKTKLVFSTTKLCLSELREIQQIIRRAYSNSTQRRLSVKYWDDELCAYRTMTAYMPDTNYTKIKVSGNDIRYAPVEYTMIEY